MRVGVGLGLEDFLFLFLFLVFCSGGEGGEGGVLELGLLWSKRRTWAYLQIPQAAHTQGFEEHPATNDLVRPKNCELWLRPGP